MKEIIYEMANNSVIRGEKRIKMEVHNGIRSGEYEIEIQSESE